VTNNPRRGFEIMKMRAIREGESRLAVRSCAVDRWRARGGRSGFALADRTRPLFRIDAECVRAFVHR
jgi:hypothetical protein